MASSPWSDGTCATTVYGHEGWHVKDRAVRIQDLITFKKLFFSLFRSIQERHPVNMRYICATKLKDSCIYAIFYWNNWLNHNVLFKLQFIKMRWSQKVQTCASSVDFFFSKRLSCYFFFKDLWWSADTTLLDVLFLWALVLERKKIKEVLKPNTASQITSVSDPDPHRSS